VIPDSIEHKLQGLLDDLNGGKNKKGAKKGLGAGKLPAGFKPSKQVELNAKLEAAMIKAAVSTAAAKQGDYSSEVPGPARARAVDGREAESSRLGPLRRPVTSVRARQHTSGRTTTATCPLKGVTLEGWCAALWVCELGSVRPNLRCVVRRCGTHRKWSEGACRRKSRLRK